MTARNFVKRLLTKGCIYFSVIMLVYIIIAAIMNVGDDELLLSAGRVVLFFVFSVLLAAANAYGAEKVLGDGVHPATFGHALISDILTSAVEGWFK